MDKEKSISYVSHLKKWGGKEEPASNSHTIHDKILQYMLNSWNNSYVQTGITEGEVINFAGKDAGRRLGLEGKVESPKTGKDIRNNMGTFIHSFIHYLLSIIHPINIYLAPYCVGHSDRDEKKPHHHSTFMELII